MKKILSVLPMYESISKENTVCFVLMSFTLFFLTLLHSSQLKEHYSVAGLILYLWVNKKLSGSNVYFTVTLFKTGNAFCDAHCSRKWRVLVKKKKIAKVKVACL